MTSEDVFSDAPGPTRAPQPPRPRGARRAERRTKSRGNGEGTIYQRKDGRWCAELVVQITPDGRRQVWRSYGKTRHAVAAALAKALEDRRIGQLVVGDRTTVAEYLRRWMVSVEPTLAPKTVVEYRRYVERVLCPRLGEVALRRLTGVQLQQLYDTLGREGRSSRYIRMTHAVIRKALQDAVGWGQLAINVARGAKLPRQEIAKQTLWGMSETTRFLEAIAGDPDELVYSLAIASGCRAGEIFGLKWSAVDWATNSITIYRQVQRIAGKGLIIREYPKTRRSIRTITLPGTIMEALRRQRERVEAWKREAGERWRDHDLVFPQRNGLPQDNTIVRRKLRRICRELGVTEIRFHDLRHLSASLLIRIGTHVKVIQERLGHSSIQVTMDTYGHLIDSPDREAAEALGSILSRRGAAV